MMATSGYRPDVDGLRTIAVTAVVIYHAFPGSLTGGYVGVDVFFVVSGFLITSVIVDDLERGRFSIVDYYGRRARRILPALIVMVLAGLAVGAIILFPGDFQDLARSTAATALFLSNVWFWLDRQDYFADAVEFAPLLHTWSLAVEEQFYIVAPLLLALVLRHGRGPAIVAMSAICAAALALSAATSAGSHGFAFYLPLTRAYELGLGALLALVPASRLSLPRSAREAAAASGLAMIIVAVFAFDGATVFPGVAALLPCVGTALVIAAGSQGQTVVGGLLSLGPLVFVGLVSYSWYLWHWPVLAFTRVHLGTVDLPPSVALSAVAGSFGLAVLSWRFVEQPFRRRRGVIAPGTGAFAASAAGIAALVAAAAMVELGGGLPQRFEIGRAHV